MPKLVKETEVMTAQEWMQLGYPAFVASALEGLNTDLVETDDDPEGMLTPERAAAQGTESLMRECMEWEGIIGYTSQIVDAVRKLDKMKGED